MCVYVLGERDNYIDITFLDISFIISDIFTISAS